MSSVRPTWLVAGLLVTLTGCAQSGSLLSQRTTVGSLKTSVSHLEYENQQLRREVASLKGENREFENRLVQEEAINGDLTARLDDARSLLAQRGLDGGGGGSASDHLDPAPPEDAPHRAVEPETPEAPLRPDPRPDRRPPAVFRRRDVVAGLGQVGQARSRGPGADQPARPFVTLVARGPGRDRTS